MGDLALSARLHASVSAAARVIALLASVLTLAGCANAQPGPALALPAAAALPGSPRSHVVVIPLENEGFSAVIGNSRAPFINGLARRYGLATRYYGIAHPSLPNYLALIGGSTFGVSSDCTDCSVSARNLVDQLEAAGLSWRAYMQGLPGSCSAAGASGAYAKKHDPFMYFRDIAGRRARCQRVVSYARLGEDLRRGSLPTFAWITPDLCNDGHDCPLAQADRFLASVAPALLHELGPHGLLVLLWDEGSDAQGCCAGQAAGGRVPLILAGPDVRAGSRSPLATDHYSTLRTIEDALGLPALGHAASPATGSLSGLFVRSAHIR